MTRKPKSSTSKPPASQFYWADFMRDPVVKAMSLEQRGAYITLLCYAWFMDDPGMIPDDDEILARLSDAGERWPAIKSGVLRAFARGDGCFVQKRMARDAAAMKTGSEILSAKGAAGANARWRRQLATDESATTNMPLAFSGDARSMPGDASSSSSSASEPVEPRQEGREGDPSPPSAAALIKGLSKKLSITRTSVHDSVEKRFKHLSKDRLNEVHKFAGWLQRTGTRDPRVVVLVCQDMVDRRCDNPFAMYAKDSGARNFAECAARETIASEDKVQQSMEFSEFMEGFDGEE